MKPHLPNILTIGAMKAGTTSLHHYLDMHPDIYMSKIKEPHFFVKEENWSKGLDWYKKLFVTDKVIRGESSQGYTKCHSEKGVAKRIKETIPNVKLIYLLRDPIDRIISHAVEYFTEIHKITDLNKDLSGNLDIHIVKTSMYYYQISEYLKYFDLNQIHILTLEDLRDNRLEEMNKIFDFIGVKRLNDNKIFDFVKNSGQEKVIKNKFAKISENSSLKNIVKKVFRINTFNKFKRSKLYEKIFTKPVAKPVITPEIEKRLIEYLKDDVNKLKDLTGLTFDKWKMY